jgi:cell division protein YceG involved in septum cleavage
MIIHLVLAGSIFIVVFIIFLVIARTMNTIINQLTKLEYLIKKDMELKKERGSKDIGREQNRAGMNPAESAPADK